MKDSIQGDCPSGTTCYSPSAPEAPSGSSPSVTPAIAAPKLRGEVFYVPEDVAATPANGECLCDRWWTVHPEKGLAFYFQPFGYAASEEPSPQCNSQQFTAEHLQKRLYPGHETKFVPVVFMSHAIQAMGRRRAELRKLRDAQRTEARRAETRSGSVHEGLVREADAPNLPPSTHPETSP